MRLHLLSLVALPALALVIAGCERKSPEPQPTATPIEPAPAITPSPAPTPVPSLSPTAEPSIAAKPTKAALDMGALNDRKDPDRLLRFYAAALSAKDWGAAARAWGKGSGVTAATLKAAYDRPEPALLEIGKTTAEGGAGSLYYEAPVVLRFGAGATPERGTLLVRRVNDVDGATADQLRWHIERATIGVGQ
jgi:hypothetical protein